MGSEDPPEPYRRIGSGAGSSVWIPGKDEHPLATYAFKRGDGVQSRSIQKAFDMNQYVQQLVQRLTSILCEENDLHLKAPGTDIPLFFYVPYCHRLLHDAKQDPVWWQEARPLFPDNHFRCPTIQMERIPPMHEKARQALIEGFCPVDFADEVIASEPKSNCLIRPYLGRRRWRVVEDMYRTNACFSLYNFPLHRDQMESLKLAGQQMARYAMAMAQTLAMLHWLGQLDGNGVEFVLGSPRNNAAADKFGKTNCPVLDSHTVWVFDFECCSHITMNEEGVDQAVSAFLHNEPYYPRPSSDEILWTLFKDFYITSSRRVLAWRKLHGDEAQEDLPDRFIRKLVQHLGHAEERRARLDPRSPEVPEPGTESSEPSEPSETSEAPGTPETPLTPATPESPQSSEPSDTLSISESPEASEDLSTLDGSEASETSEASEDQGMLKYVSAPITSAVSGVQGALGTVATSTKKIWANLVSQGTVESTGDENMSDVDRAGRRRRRKERRRKAKQKRRRRLL